MVDLYVAIIVGGLVALNTLQLGYIAASWKANQVNVNEVEKFMKSDSSIDALNQDVQDTEEK